ncbi:ParB/RepB/Spo0J family partition protein [Haoranjiania flava]|uniref:ParB/RepB/Spo0J family partition protein n=1 Tax=Haoranjiania flava TaxID=1856322 RepID=A0AAE3LKH0_9BACT|nr:ParB/RepB/Spo0J family partition protein [Haoranjiania flava]MCU7694872.1 ParB/RepB/Spo0J family partition protein [Haoranjiania flava]
MSKAKPTHAAKNEPVKNLSKQPHVKPSGKEKAALGKGLSSLLQNIKDDLKMPSGDSLKQQVREEVTSVVKIPVTQIEPNPKNPRKDFDKQALEELAASIRIHDIIQPLTVSKIADGKYRLIAGERRFKAAKIAGLRDVPVYVRQADDSELLELALLENLQREDLNAIEIGLSYQRMMDELSYTQEKVAERMGKERSTITNYIRLLKLPPDIQLAVRNGELSMGHARAISGLENVDSQLVAFKEVKDRHLSVRQTEELVRRMNIAQNPAKKSTEKPALPPAYKRVEDNLSSHFGTRVKLAHNTKKGEGSITIEYYSLAEFNKLLDLMNVQVG